ncbi:MAG: hypothetical protein WCK60_01635 [Candidatus Nomurabacteria bacterium]
MNQNDNGQKSPQETSTQQECQKIEKGTVGFDRIPRVEPESRPPAMFRQYPAGYRLYGDGRQW